INIMTQINNFITKINSLCDFYLEYDTDNNRYKFNQQFADEINSELFDDELEKLKNELFEVLDDLRDKGNLIKQVASILDKQISWYQTERIFDFASFHKLNSNSVNIAPSRIKSKNIKTFEFIEKFTPSIVKTKDNNIEKSKYPKLSSFLQLEKTLSDDKDELFYYIIAHKLKTNNYEDENDFEKVKLH